MQTFYVKIAGILQAESRTKHSSFGRAAVVSAISSLIVWAMFLPQFTGKEVNAAKPGILQKRRPSVVIPVKYENTSPIPVNITEVSAEAGEVVISGGTTGTGTYVPFVDEGEPVRKITFTIKVVNQSAYPTMHLSLAIQQRIFLSDDAMMIGIGRTASEGEGWVDRLSKSHLIKPQEVITFATSFYVRERKNDMKLMEYLSDFQLKIVGMSYETKRGRVDSWSDSIAYELGRRGGIVSLSDSTDNLQISTSYVYPKETLRK